MKRKKVKGQKQKTKKTKKTKTKNHKSPGDISEEIVNMSEGILKPEKDFSAEADKQIPEAEKLASVRPSAFDPLYCARTLIITARS